jgi:CheY-like chemotaxis protein
MSEHSKIRTMMTIDDSELDQILYKRVITRSGLVEKVISFQYAEDALSYLKSDDREKIDVILLDINMPRMSGFDFLERALSDLGPEFSTSVVIMLTTSLVPADEKRAKQFEVVKAYLNKPLSPEGLENIVRLFP